jgi:TatD DNase family protein
MIDTHTHLYFEWFDSDRSAAIMRARNNGVNGFIAVAVDLESSELIRRQINQEPDFYAAYGIHPNYVAKSKISDREKLAEMIKQDKRVVAVGEVGLDYYRGKDVKIAQQELFLQMVDLAAEFDLPLIIHNREADRDIIELLQAHRHSNTRGVFHCFSSDREMAQKVLDLNFHISFTGNITFKNFQFPEVLTYVPDERLLLETDAPFLAPVPHRGKRNEPAYLPLIAAHLAEMREQPLAVLQELANQNTRKLFNRMQV